MSALLQQPQKMQQIDIIKIYEKKRCLIVDDLTEVRALYKRMLRSFGVKELDTAATADQTMELCRNHNYGMIICDYNLDDSRDGQQILEELRHMQMLKYTTLFIIITPVSITQNLTGAQIAVATVLGIAFSFLIATPVRTIFTKPATE